MIRAGGILAVVASLVLLGLLLRSVHSVEVPAVVLKDAGLNLSTSSSLDWAAIYLRFPKDPTPDDLRRYSEAGIRVPLIAEIEGVASKVYGVQIWPEIADALLPDDDLRLRSIRLQIGLGDHHLEWTWMRCEVRRGSEVRIVGGPRNAKFSFVVASIVGAPIVLWGLAAGTTVLVGRRGSRPRAETGTA